MYIKVHKSYRQVVAICDSEIIGKRFEEGIRLLDLRENFYRGELIDKEKAKKMLVELAKEDATFNIAGERAVEVALECGLISKQGIKRVCGVPFALVLL